MSVTKQQVINYVVKNNGIVNRAILEDLLDGVSTGPDTSDATATAADIAIGKTAYVNGVKITGTYEEPTAPAPEEAWNE